MWRRKTLFQIDKFPELQDLGILAQFERQMLFFFQIRVCKMQKWEPVSSSEWDLYIHRYSPESDNRFCGWSPPHPHVVCICIELETFVCFSDDISAVYHSVSQNHRCCLVIFASSNHDLPYRFWRTLVVLHCHRDEFVWWIDKSQQHSPLK